MDKELLSQNINKLEKKLTQLASQSEFFSLETIDEKLREEMGILFRSYSAESERQTIINNQPTIIKVQEQKPQNTLPPKKTEPQIKPPAPKDKIPDNLDSLKLHFINCEKCGLSQDRKTLVFGQGNQNAKLLFVGEAPGEEEDKSGLAFVGKAGKLLTQVVQSIGINRESIYICNVIKCRPPDNRNPTSHEIETCLPILLKQIKLVNPKLIVTLGNIATKALVPEALGIMKMRGRLTRFEDYPLLPTFHPSYLLRNPNVLNLVWEDMRLVRQTLFKTTSNDSSKIHPQKT